MKNARYNLYLFLFLVLIILGVMSLQFLPWWSFIVPVAITGFIVRVRKYKIAAFTTGFVAGFVAWTSSLLYFHMAYNGILLSKTGPGLFIIPTAAGITGGFLCGCALYCGTIIVRTTPVTAGGENVAG